MLRHSLIVLRDKVHLGARLRIVERVGDRPTFLGARSPRLAIVVLDTAHSALSSNRAARDRERVRPHRDGQAHSRLLPSILDEGRMIASAKRTTHATDALDESQ